MPKSRGKRDFVRYNIDGIKHALVRDPRFGVSVKVNNQGQEESLCERETERRAPQVQFQTALANISRYGLAQDSCLT